MGRRDQGKSEQRSRRVRLRAWLIAAIGAAFTALIASIFTSAGSSFWEWLKNDPPLTATPFQKESITSLEGVSSGGWFIPGSIDSLQYPANAKRLGNEGWDRWAREQGGIPASATPVEVLVVGRSETPTVLTGLRVTVLERSAPSSGVRIILSAGGPLPIRTFVASLDQDPAEISYVNDYVGDASPRPLEFPYTISAASPEVFRIWGYSEEWDCRWVADLDWIHEGKTGTTRIDNNGQPFRTVGTKNTPIYFAGAGKFERVG